MEFWLRNLSFDSNITSNYIIGSFNLTLFGEVTHRHKMSTRRQTNRSYVHDYANDYEPGSTYDTLGTTYDSAGTTYDLTNDGAYGATGYGTADYATDYATDTTGVTYDALGNTGYSRTSYDPNTGSYDQHLDYDTGSSRRHHRERVDSTGTYRHRDVDRRDDGTTHVHRDYDNPNTGTSYHRDYER